MNKKIISQAKLKERYRYCPETGNLYHKTSPSPRVRVGDKIGPVRNDEYFHLTIEGKAYLAHRIVWVMAYGYWPTEIDHINRNGNDNRLENLREVTRSENVRNTKTYKNNTSGIKGVSFYNPTGAWRAYININKKRIYLGCSTDWWEAVCLRKTAENLYH